MNSTDRAWRRWGEADPYYAVLSDPRFSGAGATAHREEFFASGRGFLMDRLAQSERLFGVRPCGRALDFGCGVGRLSLPLAGVFDEVTGLDISPAMLSEARANAAALNIAPERLRFAVSDDDLSAASGEYHLVMSLMVLQHIPVRRGMRIIDALLGRVEEGGIASLHLCVGRNDGWVQAASYWARCHVPGAQGLLNMAKGRPFAAPVMQMNAYSLDCVLARATARGFGHAFVTFEPHGRFLTAHLLMHRNV